MIPWCLLLLTVLVLNLQLTTAAPPVGVPKKGGHDKVEMCKLLCHYGRKCPPGCDDADLIDWFDENRDIQKLISELKKTDKEIKEHTRHF